MMTRSRRSREKISYDRSPLPYECQASTKKSKNRHSCMGLHTVCSMTMGTRPAADGDDQFAASG